MNLSHSARLLFIGLITQADDAGRGRADRRRIKAAIFPADDIDADSVDNLWSSLVNQGLVTEYSVSTHGALYEIQNWHKHQRINRPAPSNYPPSDQSHTDSVTPHGALMEDSLGIGSEGIGSERKGEDRKDGADARKLSQVEIGEWSPDEDCQNACAHRGFDPRVVFEKFRAYHKSRGTVSSNWIATWELWLSRERKEKADTTRVKSQTQVADDLRLSKAAEIAGQQYIRG